ncbi:MAG: hypothetical protein K0Q70_2244, partial [Rhodospirillales bacterium]|nr:hypothetical protein [Rhodospirillales bacterium]
MNDITSIDIKQVSKYFPSNGQKKGFKALDNANFSIKPGEFVCIL